MVTLDELIAYTVRHAVYELPGAKYFIYVASGGRILPQYQYIYGCSSTEEFAINYVNNGRQHSVIITNDGCVLYDNVFGTVPNQGRYTPGG